MLALFVLVSLVCSGGAYDKGHYLDPAKGEIDGKVAMAAMVVEDRGDGQALSVPSDGFSVHLAPFRDPYQEVVTPCGEWFQPEADYYRMWLEGEWTMTPFTSRLAFADTPFAGVGMVTGLPVAGAGRVALADDFLLAQHLTLRLFYAENAIEKGFARWHLSRSRTTTRVGAGLLLPAGRALAGIWDEESERYVALSRPFQVEERTTTAAPVEAVSKERAHLMLRVRRDGLARTPADYGTLELALLRPNVARAPDLVFQAADRIFAVWYDLEPGLVEVEARTHRGHVVEGPIDLVAGTIQSVSASLESP